MASNLIKLRLRAGDREIEVEGSRAEIERILETWWPTVNQGHGSGGSPKRSEPALPAVERTEVHRTGSGDAVSTNGRDEASSVDLHAAAMSMKEDPRYGFFEREILHGSDQWRKIGLVLWFVDRPLTSGQIQKILDSLDIRVGLPALSTVLKRKSKNLISNQQRRLGGKPPTYRLTSQAKNEFVELIKHAGI